MSRISCLTVASVVGSLVLSTQSASAQLFPTGVNPSGTTALQDVSAGAVHQRAPGNISQSAIARHNAFQIFNLSVMETPVTDDRAQAIADVLKDLFVEINKLIQALQAVIIARGGTVPTPLTDLTNTLGGGA